MADLMVFHGSVSQIVKETTGYIKGKVRSLQSLLNQTSSIRTT
jgi:hypothetical protein